MRSINCSCSSRGGTLGPAAKDPAGKDPADQWSPDRMRPLINLFFLPRPAIAASPFQTIVRSSRREIH